MTNQQTNASDVEAALLDLEASILRVGSSTTKHIDQNDSIDGSTNLTSAPPSSHTASSPFSPSLPERNDDVQPEPSFVLSAVAASAAEAAAAAAAPMTAASHSILDVSYDASCAANSTSLDNSYHISSPPRQFPDTSTSIMRISAIAYDDNIVENDNDEYENNIVIPKVLFPEELSSEGPADAFVTPNSDELDVTFTDDEDNGHDEDEDDDIQYYHNEYLNTSYQSYSSSGARAAAYGSMPPSPIKPAHQKKDNATINETGLSLSASFFLNTLTESIADSFCYGGSSGKNAVTPQSSPCRPFNAPAAGPHISPIRHRPPLTPLRQSSSRSSRCTAERSSIMEDVVRDQLERMDCYNNTATPIRSKDRTPRSSPRTTHTIPAAPLKKPVRAGREADVNFDARIKTRPRKGQSVKVRNKNMQRRIMELSNGNENIDLNGSDCRKGLLGMTADPSLSVRRRQVYPQTCPEKDSETSDTVNLSVSIISDAKSFDGDGDKENFGGDTGLSALEDSVGEDADLSQLIGSCIEPIPSIIGDSGALYGHSPFIDELGYDSDPGIADASFTRKQFFLDGNNTSTQEKNVLADTCRSEPKSTAQKPIHGIDKRIDDLSSIQHTMSETLSLTWHPAAVTANEMVHSKRPRRVSLWMEKGISLSLNGERQVIEPKIVWRDYCYQQITPSASLFQTPSAIEMLSITRVIECNNLRVGIDRNTYPFALTSRSFIITTCNGDEYLFQARDERERDEIVSKWKLVVARLACLALLNAGNSLSKEFFKPFHHCHLESPLAVTNDLQIV